MDELVLNINLQLFADPEAEGRTLEPTAEKLRKAREEGKVAKTPDLSSALIMLVSFTIIAIMGKSILSDLLLFTRRIFQSVKNPEIVISAGSELGTQFVYHAFKILFPILLGVFIFAFLADVVQIGFKFTTKTIEPKLSKISFTFEKMMERVIFSRQILVNLIKTSLKFVVIVFVGIVIVKGDYQKIISTMHLPVSQSIGIISWIAFKVIIWIGIILIIFSVLDFFYQKWEHRQYLKMSIQEFKEERRQQEGDPFIRARQKERHRELSMRRMMQEVPKADVVITNPTHYAVALVYELNQDMAAPRVVAKGADLIAKKIKEIAKENDVPIVENRYLARAIYSSTEIGDDVPEELWEALARVFMFLDKFKNNKNEEAV